MSGFFVKAGGAYGAATAVFVKKGGVYVDAAGEMKIKTGGLYILSPDVGATAGMRVK